MRELRLEKEGAKARNKLVRQLEDLVRHFVFFGWFKDLDFFLFVVFSSWIYFLFGEFPLFWIVSLGGRANQSTMS